MRQVILQIDITLDGFVCGPQGEHDWVKPDDAMNRDALALLETADTILLGRVAYQDFAQYWPFADSTGSSVLSQITRRLNEATKLVFSRTLNTAIWGKWNNARVVRESVNEAATQWKSQPGKNLVLYAGAAIVTAFIQQNLVDDYRLRIHPTILGAGRPLFGDKPPTRTLTLVQSKHYQNGCVLVQYRPSPEQSVITPISQ